MSRRKLDAAAVDGQFQQKLANVLEDRRLAAGAASPAMIVRIVGRSCAVAGELGADADRFHDDVGAERPGAVAGEEIVIDFV